MLRFIIGFVMLMFAYNLPAQFEDLMKAIEDTIDEALESEDSSVPIPEVYTFDYEYEMEMKDKHGTTNFTYYINMPENVVAMVNVENDETTTYLLDHERKKSFVYIEGNGNKGMTSLPYINTAKMAKRMAKNREGHNKVTATGKTKNIAGYPCKEYKTMDKKNEGYLYINHEVELDNSCLFGFQSVPTNDFVQGTAVMQSGLMMGIRSHKKGKPDKNAVNMECVKLKKGTFRIVNSQYSRVD